MSQFNSDSSANKDLIKGALDVDPWLEPFSPQLINRQLQFKEWHESLLKSEKSLDSFASSYEKYGVHADWNTKQITVTQYVPDVKEVSIVGDFNHWDPNSHKLVQANNFGLWSLTIDAVDGEFVIPHDSRYKISMLLPSGERIYRLDPWVIRATPSTENTLYEGRFWNPNPSDVYKRKTPRPKNKDGIKIYEAHVGISTPEAKVGSYKNFTTKILPIIHRLGYNSIQLMAVMEHAYYASFGYQVTNFFAASSRFGSPEDLKELIDEAHRR
ncbi:alpha-1,4-glucan branching enzyme [Cerrena zonata]|uniref:Alpha-1,4-glucan branching enzyme n=1 Tax=Cerrena zonata TaxID=2478898 RepID=A0AAW0FS05_9APHY